MQNIKIGTKYSYRYTVPFNKTVPYQYPEIEELQLMPKVFTSGYMIGLFEFVCVKFLVPYLDWPNEQSVGVDFNLSHVSPTPPGFNIEVNIELIDVDENKLLFYIRAHDGMDTISEGTHERYVIKEKVFLKKIERKIKALS